MSEGSISEGGPIDEMVDGRRRLRPHWRGLLGSLSGLGPDELRERARRLERTFAEEGVASLLPGADRHSWQCDPVPLPLAAAEFAMLEAGLGQRAQLLEAILQDVYGSQTLLAGGLLPPALVYGNPHFLRAVRSTPSVDRRFLHFYATDLTRGPDGAWRVCADRTSDSSGIAYALENRRVLGRVVPEAFRGALIKPLRPFFDTWQESLQRLAPARHGRATTALLTPGTGSPQWFEHMFLSRELACQLVESRDLTVRGGIVFIKTLKGLQPVDVLLRGLDGALLDPLELEPSSLKGVAGLMDAMRSGTVWVANNPGSSLAEAPALSAFLPALAHRLLGEALQLSAIPSMWLGDSEAYRSFHSDPERWLIRPAADAAGRVVAFSSSTAAARTDLLARIEADPTLFAAFAPLPASEAPSVGATGLEPKPIVLRLFLVFDGETWRAMAGGLARIIEPSHVWPGAVPLHAVSKDVWVLHEEGEDIVGPAAHALQPTPVCHPTGDLPSRVADDLFWLGRYVERLETSARLIRAALERLGGIVLPRELTELQILASCLAQADLVPADMATVRASSAALAVALQRSIRDSGAMMALLARIEHLTERLRDRLTGEMYATFTHALRQTRREAAEARSGLDTLHRALVEILRFAATFAGLTAENMVRGGGWLFLDLGRRIERGHAIAREMRIALDLPAHRLEAGLKLALELNDSAITYRTRYLTALQPAPVLDLVLADTSNPRALAFQLAAIEGLLRTVDDVADSGLAAEARSLLATTHSLVERVANAPDQAAEAALLPAAMHQVAAGIAVLSDRIGRHYFALLSLPQTLGAGEEPEARSPAAAAGAN
jgi:uncharacterized circularly permuted ATP-grasp superfamily protein/uncharacterized alpha-E superfamily protein